MPVDFNIRGSKTQFESMGEPKTKEPKLDQAVTQKTEAEPEPETVQETNTSSGSENNTSHGPGTVRKKQRVEGERICKVCGDKAVAHNFDVITCESCKTFFRRNAHKTQKECSFQGNCEITIQMRRFCPSCRLKKCFAVGMRADMILDEVGRQARMEKILTNRKKRQEGAKKTQEQAKDTTKSSPPDDTIPSPLDDTITYPPDNTTPYPPYDTTTYPPDDTTPYPSDDTIHYPPDNTTPCQPDSASEAGLDHAAVESHTVETLISEIFESESLGGLSSQESAGCDTHHPAMGTSCRGRNASADDTSCPCSSTMTDGRTKACSFQHVPHSLLPSDPMMYWRLSSEEHVLITDLTVVYKEALLQMPTTADALTLQLENLSLRQTLSYCGRFASEIIKFLKRMPDFQTLEIGDQQCVLKSSAMMCLMLKSSACFSEERDAWLKDFGLLPVDVFARLTRHEDVVTRYASFCRTLKRIVKNDYSTYVLLSCIVIFQPQAANLLDRQTVNFYQEKYTTLLKHYLESQFSYIFAAQYMEAIQDSICQGKILSVDMTDMFSNWKEFLQPLMAEVINLT